MAYTYTSKKQGNKRNTTTHPKPNSSIYKLLHAHSSSMFHAHINTSLVRRVIMASGTILGTRNRSTEKLNTEYCIVLQAFCYVSACIFITYTKKGIFAIRTIGE